MNMPGDTVGLSDASATEAYTPAADALINNQPNGPTFDALCSFDPRLQPQISGTALRRRLITAEDLVETELEEPEIGLLNRLASAIKARFGSVAR